MSRRAWAFDLAVALAVGAVGQLEAWWGVGSTHRQGPVWAQSLLYACTALLLVGRRLRPRLCLAAIAVLSVVEFALVGSPEGFAVSLAALIATYTVADRLEWRRSWVGLLLSVGTWVAWAAFDPNNPDLVQKLGSMVWLAPGIVAWLLGALVRLARLNAEQRRVNREQQTARALAEERNQIARELHDVVGHSVSVMTLQASAVRRRLTPDQSLERQTLETVESVGREALAEMRRMVGVLRRAEAQSVSPKGEGGRPPAGGSAELEPAPGLDQLDRLVEQFRAAGLPVAVARTGTPRSLPPGLDLTAYRLVQEGLTNTLRHARDPICADVGIDFGPGRLRLSVRDDGRPGSAAGPVPVGNGLLGMRERVGLYGGTLVAGPRAEGGFELVATLPLEPA